MTTMGYEIHRPNSIDYEVEDDDEEEVCTELKTHKKKALMEFRDKLQDAILGNDLFSCSKDGQGSGEPCSGSSLDISLWGIPLLPSEGHEGTDVILLKFLKAKDFKVSEAFEMLRKTLIWRKEFKVDAILEENLCSHLEALQFSYFCDTDRDGRPLLYSNSGVYKDRDLYNKTFGTEAQREEYIRWRIQMMERAMQQLSFKPGEADSIISIIDMKDSPRWIKEWRIVSNKVIWMLHEFYPETVRRYVFLNVSLWFYTCQTLSCKIFDPKNRRKFFFVRPTGVSKILTKSTAPEHIPVKYGGLRRENDDEFSPENEVLEMTVRAGAIESIQIQVQKPGVTVVWDVAAMGSDVVYREEFIPDDECSYRILIQDEKKLEASVRNSFYINEPGLILLTIDNGGYKRKKVVYRFKTKPTFPSLFPAAISSSTLPQQAIM